MDALIDGGVADNTVLEKPKHKRKRLSWETNPTLDVRLFAAVSVNRPWVGSANKQGRNWTKLAAILSRDPIFEGGCACVTTARSPCDTPYVIY